MAALANSYWGSWRRWKRGMERKSQWHLVIKPWKGHQGVTCGARYRAKSYTSENKSPFSSLFRKTHPVCHLIFQVLFAQLAHLSSEESGSQKFPTKFHMETPPSLLAKLRHSHCDMKGWPWGQQIRNSGDISITWVIKPPWTKKTDTAFDQAEKGPNGYLGNSTYFLFLPHTFSQLTFHHSL